MKRRLIGATIALLSVIPFAHAQEPAPCTAGLTTTKITPCGEPLATIGDKPVTAADLDEETRQKVADPTDAAVAAEMASDPKKYKKGKEYEEWAAGILYDRRLKAREKALVAQIEKRFPIAHAGDP